MPSEQPATLDALSRFLLDLHPHFMIVVQGEKIAYLNRRLLEFLGFSSMDLFARAGGDFTAYIQELDHSAPGDDWLGRILSRGSGDAVLHLKGVADRLDDEVSCLVGVHGLPGTDLVVLQLTDLEDMVQETGLQELQASTDLLTGVYNKRKIQEIMDSEARRADRYMVPLSLVAVGVHDFAGFRERHGAEAADILLMDLAGLVAANIRLYDTIGRVENDFVVLAPGTDQEGAMALARKLDRLVEAGDLGSGPPPRCCFGVSGFAPGEGTSVMLTRTLDALSEAKERGPGQVATR
jgi:diguanylate cyclase (GGDEF)-like protein